MSEIKIPIYDSDNFYSFEWEDTKECVEVLEGDGFELGARFKSEDGGVYCTFWSRTCIDEDGEMYLEFVALIDNLTPIIYIKGHPDLFKFVGEYLQPSKGLMLEQ